MIKPNWKSWLKVESFAFFFFSFLISILKFEDLSTDSQLLDLSVAGILKFETIEILNVKA